MAADKAERYGISLPQPSEEVRRILEANIPDFGSARNPCDVTGQVVNNPLSMPACSDALLSDAGLWRTDRAADSGIRDVQIGLESLVGQSQRHGKITCSVLIPTGCRVQALWKRSEVRMSHYFVPWIDVCVPWRRGTIVRTRCCAANANDSPFGPKGVAGSRSIDRLCAQRSAYRARVKSSFAPVWDSNGV